MRFLSQLNTLNATDRQFKSNLRFSFPTVLVVVVVVLTFKCLI